jgi:hypothetical protein
MSAVAHRRLERHVGLRHVAAIAAVLAPMALAASCGSGATDDPSREDAGSSSGAVAPAACPTAVPVGGASCSLPEGTTCAFGACDTRYARCASGVWQIAQNGLGRPICPAQPPAVGEACPPCWPSSSSCLYGSVDCAAADASANRAVATCGLEGTWVIGFEPCQDGGGPDVQRDAGPDAD